MFLEKTSFLKTRRQKEQNFLLPQSFEQQDTSYEAKELSPPGSSNQEINFSFTLLSLTDFTFNKLKAGSFP